MTPYLPATSEGDLAIPATVSSAPRRWWLASSRTSEKSYRESAGQISAGDSMSQYSRLRSVASPLPVLSRSWRTREYRMLTSKSSPWPTRVLVW